MDENIWQDLLSRFGQYNHREVFRGHLCSGLRPTELVRSDIFSLQKMPLTSSSFLETKIDKFNISNQNWAGEFQLHRFPIADANCIDFSHLSCATFPNGD